MNGEENKKIPLNLIYDYPVKWSKYKVLRDFIQNFYDAVGYASFNDRFSFNLSNDNVLSMEASNVSFNYEWLIHIGASSKREQSDAYAGYFGEGFKMASLCALRDHGWQVEMLSKNWQLNVSTEEISIDNKTMKSLAYHIKEVKYPTTRTILKLHPFFENDLEAFKSALWSFYYKENPIIGKSIYEDEKIALYYRSSTEKPRYYPCSWKVSGSGVIFASYQAMGSVEVPIVVCLHSYERNDRDRDSFSAVDVVNTLVRVSELLPSQHCQEVLELFYKYWYTYPKKKYGYESFYSTIRKLVKRLSESKEHSKSFTTKYPNLLIAKSIKGASVGDRNKRKEAKTWLKSQDSKYILVQDGFKALEYKSLEEKCAEENGFSYIRPPNKVEAEGIKLLESCTKEVADDLFGNQTLPRCDIISNKDAVWAGFAECKKLAKPIKSIGGAVIRYQLNSVALKHYLFKPDSFDRALGVYIHEMCHVFGGDQSQRFSGALTIVIYRLINHADKLVIYNNNWNEIFSSISYCSHFK